VTSTFPTTGFKNRTFLNIFISQSLNIIYTLIFTLSILHFILYQIVSPQRSLRNKQYI